VVILADNDVLFKLAACDLLEKLPDLFGVPATSFRVLNTARYVARDDPKVRETYGEEAIERVLGFLESARTLTEDDVPIDVLGELIKHEAIDAGEALLFAASTQHDAVRIITGDKNSLKSLRGSELTAVIDSVDGCVICFEQLMHRFSTEMEYVSFRKRVVAAPDCDGVLHDIAFSRGSETPATTARAAFQSYTESLREDVGSLLVTGWMN
jgi:hypothetical protein